MGSFFDKGVSPENNPMNEWATNGAKQGEAGSLQAVVVVTFLHVPGVPLLVHTNSVAAESM
jgi:hypothetical protein